MSRAGRAKTANQMTAVVQGAFDLSALNRAGLVLYRDVLLDRLASQAVKGDWMRTTAAVTALIELETHLLAGRGLENRIVYPSLFAGAEKLLGHPDALAPTAAATREALQRAVADLKAAIASSGGAA